MTDSYFYSSVLGLVKNVGSGDSAQLGKCGVCHHTRAEGVVWEHVYAKEHT